MVHRESHSNNGNAPRADGRQHLPDAGRRSVFDDDVLAATFDNYWWSSKASARDRLKLYRLAWDLVGSEFAGRHLQYEKFYSGPGVVVRGHSHREAPWRALTAWSSAPWLSRKTGGRAALRRGFERPVVRQVGTKLASYS